MTDQQRASAADLAEIVASHGPGADQSNYRARLQRFAESARIDELPSLVEPYRDEPDVIAPAYERIVEANPSDARALVILANAYWLQGRGPEVVDELASRALSIDPANRGAWHLWALAEPNPRLRTQRWQQVSERFKTDQLALAAVADNAAAVAGAEHDYEMLDLAIASFERLLEGPTEPPQRQAVEEALRALRGWRF